MSHKVQVSVALNTQGELMRIADMEREIDSCAGIYKTHLKNEINKAKAELATAKEEIEAIGNNTVTDNNKALIEYQGRIDTIIKRIANISSSIDYGSVYESIQDKVDEEINSIIASNGIMAMLAVSEINDAHEELSSKTLTEKINEIRTQRMDARKRGDVISELENTIMEIEIPDDSKTILLEQSEELSSPQELMDLIAMLKSHELSFKRMEETASKFEEALISQGFTLNGRSNAVSSKGVLELHINAFKDGTKELNIELDSTMAAKWQHGDYEYHMCKADTDGFLDKLKESDVEYSSPVVLRIHSNSRPMLRTAKLKEEGA